MPYACGLNGAITRIVRVRTDSGEQHVSCSLSLTTARVTQNTTPSVLSLPRALRIATSTASIQITITERVYGIHVIAPLTP